jgi:hypothetical protein
MLSTVSDEQNGPILEGQNGRLLLLMDPLAFGSKKANDSLPLL